MRKKLPSLPKALWTLMDTFRPEKSEDVRTMEFSARNRLDYMASRLRAILMVLSTRVNYNHAFWYEMLVYEMVFVLWFSNLHPANLICLSQHPIY